jgi:hypothetical protein
MLILLAVAGPEEAKNLAGECPPPDSDPFTSLGRLTLRLLGLKEGKKAPREGSLTLPRIQILIS